MNIPNWLSNRFTPRVDKNTYYGESMERSPEGGQKPTDNLAIARHSAHSVYIRMYSYVKHSVCDTTYR